MYPGLRLRVREDTPLVNVFVGESEGRCALRRLRVREDTPLGHVFVGESSGRCIQV